MKIFAYQKKNFVARKTPSLQQHFMVGTNKTSLHTAARQHLVVLPLVAKSMLAKSMLAETSSEARKSSALRAVTSSIKGNAVNWCGLDFIHLNW